MKASIIIRSFNEQRHIERLLNGVFSQKTTHPFEVVLVDSGSTDQTVEIAKKFNVKVVEIDPKEFTFGRSLNIGIKHSSGEFCIFVSAHCYPANEYWLENLIEPFSNPDVLISFGRQIGDKNTRFSEHQIFAKWFPDHEPHISEIPFCNNANCAIRKSLWLQRNYDEKLTGLEDIDLARYVIGIKKYIFYASKSIVYHIHDETPKQIYNRYYRESLAYKGIFPNEKFTYLDFIKFFIMNVAGDLIQAIHEKSFFRNFSGIICFRYLQFKATYQGNNYSKPISFDMQRRLYFPKKPKIFQNSKSSESNRKTLQIIDVSHKLESSFPVWPGAMRFSLDTQKTNSSDGLQDSNLHFNIHTGTHLDAPLHFLDGAEDVTQIDLTKLMGLAQIIDCSNLNVVGKSDLEEKIDLSKTNRILIKTKNSQNFGPGKPFSKDFVAITSEAAEWIFKSGIIVIGIDGPSIQLFHDKDNKTHEVLLRNKIVIIESLNLAHVNPGYFDLIALPLKISNAEGSPIRAILLPAGTL